MTDTGNEKINNIGNDILEKEGYFYSLPEIERFFSEKTITYANLNLSYVIQEIRNDLILSKIKDHKEWLFKILFEHLIYLINNAKESDLRYLFDAKKRAGSVDDKAGLILKKILGNIEKTAGKDSKSPQIKKKEKPESKDISIKKVNTK